MSFDFSITTLKRGETRDQSSTPLTVVVHEISTGGSINQDVAWPLPPKPGVGV